MSLNALEARDLLDTVRHIDPELVDILLEREPYFTRKHTLNKSLLRRELGVSLKATHERLERLKMALLVAAGELELDEAAD